MDVFTHLWSFPWHPTHKIIWTVSVAFGFISFPFPNCYLLFLTFCHNTAFLYFVAIFMLTTLPNLLNEYLHYSSGLPTYDSLF